MLDKGSGRRIYDKPMNTRITIRLDKKHVDIIKKISKEKNLTRTDVVRLAIEKLLDK